MPHPETMVTRAIAPLQTNSGDSLMVCDLESGDILALNSTARAIWEAVAEPATIASICERLQRSFVVDEDDCVQAVAAALSEFERRGFVRMTPPGARADSL